MIDKNIIERQHKTPMKKKIHNNFPSYNEDLLNVKDNFDDTIAKNY